MQMIPLFVCLYIYIYIYVIQADDIDVFLFRESEILICISYSSALNREYYRLKTNDKCEFKCHKMIISL